ncbi:Uncharacterized protein QTN25_010654 [Entamoeba marina]
MLKIEPGSVNLGTPYPNRQLVRSTPMKAHINYSIDNINDVVIKETESIDQIIIDLSDNIIADNIPDINQTGIVPIHREIYFKHRSVNLLLGKPGSSKTTSIIKELIKISALQHNGHRLGFHLIVWVNKTGEDKTLESLEHFIKVPLLKMTYDDYKEWYPKFIRDKKQRFNRSSQITSSLISSQLPETIIVLDDALGEIKNEKSEIAQSLSVCRHVNCLMIIVGQQAVVSIPSKLTSLLNSVWIFKGYTRKNISIIRQNTEIPFDLDTLWQHYIRLKDYQKLIYDNDKQRVALI